jgi:hypothetical protein
MIGICRALRLWRVRENNMRLAALACVFVAAGALGAQRPAPTPRAVLADTVIADLSKLADLERSYFAANLRYTDDIASLHFMPASGAIIAVSYASARTFSASASHARLAPFLCFVIVSDSDAASPTVKPFCTDSRYGTAATALAHGGADAEPVDPPLAPDTTRLKRRAAVTPITRRKPGRISTPSVDSSRARAAISTAQFAERLRAATRGKTDSAIVLVQFAVKDARYDPSRGIVEVAVEQIPLPLTPDSGSTRPAVTCFTSPAFVCGAAGLTYIARGLLRVPQAAESSADLLKSALTLQARFAIGRRHDTPGPSLTLLALLLQSNGKVVARWEPSGAP